MDNFAKLKALVDEADSHANKLYVKNVKVAATKLRASMQDIKNIAQDIRIDALNHQKGMPTKRRPANGDAQDSNEEDE